MFVKGCVWFWTKRHAALGAPPKSTGGVMMIIITVVRLVSVVTDSSHTVTVTATKLHDITE